MVLAPVMSDQERVALEGEAVAARVMGQVNALTCELVEMVAEVIEADAWCPWGGLRTPAHWLSWRAGIAPGRAQRLVRIAQRMPELPTCMGLFREGRLTEDAMALIARKLPASRDAEVASFASTYMHAQLARVLRHLPDQDRPDREPRSARRHVRFGFEEDGSWTADIALPADEGAVVHKALESARQALFEERRDDVDPAVRGMVDWADSLVRVAEHALDSLDPATRRGEARGERAQVLVHLDGRSDGDGNARLHLGPQLPDSLRRYLCCDAKVRAVIENAAGELLGISPLEPTVNVRLRRVIEQRDGGCRYPGCSQRRWVQVHHLVHREDGGLTVPNNLCCLCPAHHRQHHQGAFTIEGDPQQPVGLRFRNHWGHDIGPPRFGPVAPPEFRAEPKFTPPTGERLRSCWFAWN